MESASQGSAAPAEKATAELRKPHEMTVMVLTSGRMTATGRKIYEVMLHISQLRLDAMNAMPPADYNGDGGQTLFVLIETMCGLSGDPSAAKYR